MSRPPKCRWVEFIPRLTLFKPAGVPQRELQEVCLTVEELEAVRLKDLLGLEQEACAERMGISRPTFHRILTAARAKIAEALVGGKALRVEGGHFRLVERHFLCRDCGHRWDAPCSQGPPGCQLACPQCGSQNFYRVDAEGRPYPCCTRARESEAEAERCRQAGE